MEKNKKKINIFFLNIIFMWLKFIIAINVQTFVKNGNNVVDNQNNLTRQRKKSRNIFQKKNVYNFQNNYAVVGEKL